MKLTIVAVGAVFFYSLLSTNVSSDAGSAFIFGTIWATFIACLDLSKARSDWERAKRVRNKKKAEKNELKDRRAAIKARRERIRAGTQ